MALDTRSKRASATQIYSPSVLALVAPDGSIDSGDRQHIAWTYSGISAGSETPAPPAATVNEWLIRARRRGRR